MDVLHLSNEKLKMALIKQGLSKGDAEYFYQKLDEKPALKIIFNKLIDNHHKLGLDVGCGIGLIESNLPKNPHLSVVAIDLNKTFLKIAKFHSTDSSTEFLLADARYLPFKNQIFDTIILHDVLFGLKLSSVVSEISRNLKIAGNVYFDIPSSVFYRIVPFLLPFEGFNTYNLNIVEKELGKNCLKLTCRYVLAFSTNTRKKLKIPAKLNALLGKGFEMMPPKLHITISNFWFLTMFDCKRTLQ
jgi:SAM-dependent methyltransferase